MLFGIPYVIWGLAALLIVLAYIALSIRHIGPSEVGLVLKRVSHKKL